jgi:Domain of unknown function (DUF1707)
MTTPTDKEPHGRIRASDPEREEYAQILRAAMAEGRLTLEDGEERLAKAYATTYRDELDPLIDDLPRGAAFRTPEFLAEAQRRLRVHTSGVVSIAALLTGVWLLVAIVAHPVFFWPIIPIAILSIGLMKHRRWYRWQSRGGWSPWSGRGGWGSGRGWGPHGGAGWHSGSGSGSGPQCGRQG